MSNIVNLTSCNLAIKHLKEINGKLVNMNDQLISKKNELNKKLANVGSIESKFRELKQQEFVNNINQREKIELNSLKEIKLELERVKNENKRLSIENEEFKDVKELEKRKQKAHNSKCFEKYNISNNFEFNFYKSPSIDKNNTFFQILSIRFSLLVVIVVIVVKAKFKKEHLGVFIRNYLLLLVFKYIILISIKYIIIILFFYYIFCCFI